MSLNCLLFINFTNLMHFIMKYLIRIAIGLAIIFMFSVNIIAIILLSNKIPELISILWLIATIMSLLLKFNYYELIVVEVKKFLMVLATDTIDYYKKGDIHE